MTPDRFPGDASADTDLDARPSGDTTSGGSGGRKSAWSAFLLGVAVSVAANVAHTWYPSRPVLMSYAALHHGSTAGWRPSAGAQLAAAFYPCALLLTIELLTRVRWPAGMAWLAARFGGTGVVAVVAAVVSYRHMAGLLAVYGEDRLTARIGPLAVDGLMVVASFALLALGRARPPAAMTGGGSVTAPAVPADTEPTAIADPPPATPPPDPPPPPPDGRPDDDPGDDPDDAASADTDRADTAAGEGNRRQAVKRPGDTNARQRAEVLLAGDPDMTGRELATRLGVSERSGQRIARQVRESVAAHQTGNRPLRVAGDAESSS